MAKTKEELQQLKEEYESLKEKLNSLSEEEIEQIVGGFNTPEETGKKYEHSFYDGDVKTSEDFTSKLK